MTHIEDRRILLTGGAGFIGSHLAEALLRIPAKVFLFDNFDPFYSRSEKERNIRNLFKLRGLTFREGDIRDRTFLDAAIRDFEPDVLVHLAARAGVRPSLIDPCGYADVNVTGTATVLEAARVHDVRNVVYASSSSVYGNSVSFPCREDENTDRPLSPYGATKKSGEVLCHAYHHLYGMSISCLRFFTVYGPRQRPDLAIRKFVRLALRDEEIPVFGDGSSGRDYTHVSDILTGILGAIEWGAADDPRFGVFNLGSSQPILLNELLRQIEEALGKPLRRQVLPPQPGDVFLTYADTTRAETELGFRHQISFEDGLRDFVEWMRMNEYAWT